MLAFMIEILAGPLVKAAFGTGVTGTANPEEMCTKGDLMIAIDPSKLSDLNIFKDQVDEFIDQVKSTDNIFIPGDMEVRNVTNHQLNGIDIDDKLYQQFIDISNELKMDLEDLFTE